MRASLGRNGVRVGGVVLALLALLLSGAPSALGTSTPSASPAVTPRAGPAIAAASSSSALLPGSGGNGPFVNGPALFRADHAQWYQPGESLGGTNATQNASRPVPTAHSPSPVRARWPADEPSANGTGYIYGYVDDSRYHTPVVNATVSLVPAGCSLCLGGTGGTNATGYFRVQASAGPAVLTVNATDYLANRTFVTVLASTQVSVGTILLFHWAWVTGTVVADLPTFPPIGGVFVSSVSRDEALAGPATNTTGANGEFNLSIDPVSVEVDFATSAPARFYGNASFVDAIPWQSVDLGEIRLEGNVTLTATLVDAVTGVGVPGAATYTSDRIDGGSLSYSWDVGNTTYFTGVAGAGFADFSADGYLTNVTQIPDIPAGTAGPVDIGTVQMVPVGAVNFSIGFAGGTPNGTWPAALPGETSYFSVLICSLTMAGEGTVGPIQILAGGAPCTVVGGVQVGVSYQVPALPLRNILYVARDKLGYPYGPSFPLLQTFVSFPNGGFDDIAQTWLNVTPDRLTAIGRVNVSAGTYLSGSITVDPELAVQYPGAQATIQACSAVRGASCLDIAQTGSTGQAGAIPAGCPTGPWTFCVAAPPGPDQVVMSLGPARNGTWITVPFRCCAQQGHPTALGTFGLSASFGNVSGSVGVEGAAIGTLPQGGDFGATACSANFQRQQCFQLNFGANGTFSGTAPIGWDSVLVTAKGYRGNTTWVYVGGNNSTGVVELGPDAAVAGQVVSAATGAPVLEADLEACLVVAPAQCVSLGATYGSNGTYNGTIAANPYPASAYAITATAAGYETETVFSNVTAGRLVTLPTIRLPSIGVSALPRPAAARANGSSSLTTGSWVTGRVVDSRSGYGVGGATVNICYLAGSGGCAVGSTIYTESGGEFNFSAVHGGYELLINASQYETGRAYLNATVSGTVALGSVELTPSDRLIGRILFAPWASLATEYGLGADQTWIEGCDAGGGCGPLGATNSGGFFNFSLPAGRFDRVTFTGSGLLVPSCGNSYPGIAPQTTTIDVDSPLATLPGSGPNGTFNASLLTDFAGVVQQTANRTYAPAYFAVVGAVPPNSSSFTPAAGLTGVDGTYDSFVVGGLTGYVVQANALGLVPAQTAPTNGTIAAGAVVPAPELNATRFGFVLASVRDGSTGSPINQAIVATQGRSPAGVSLFGSAFSNGSGLVNVSSPPGYDAYTAAEFGFTNSTGAVAVTAGNVSTLGTVDLGELPGEGIAYARTVQVNTRTTAPAPGFYDNVTHHAVVGAEVEEISPGIGVGPVYASDLGEFLLSGVASNETNLTIVAPGYTNVTIPTPLPGGQTLVFPRMNLTADGIIAGRVASLPGNVSVPNTVLQICPTAYPTCTNYVTTNASGVFWAGAEAGIDTIVVQSAAYLANITALVNVTPDSFIELGNIPVYGFATLHGAVRGMPSGDVLAGANVTICSSFSPPNGCYPDESVSTDANGTFTITSPPGDYVLLISAPGYNSSRLPLTLNPGATVDLGIRFLEADGTVTGLVRTTAGAPVAGALIDVCGTWGGAQCVGPVPTDASGRYSVLAQPGTNQVTATITGYLDGGESVSVVTGETTIAPTIVLSPVPPNVLEWVNGSVTSATTGRPIEGLLAVATEGGSRVAQTLTSPGGGFSLHVQWGVAELFVGGKGYASQNETVVAESNLSGLAFALSAQTYLVHGHAFDGGTRGGLAGVTIGRNGTVVATSAADGSYGLLLPNGSVNLVASFPGSGPVKYGSVPFSVNVEGGGVAHDVTLPRTGVPLTGVVVSAASGVGVGGAAVEVWGGTAEITATTTAGSGSFSFDVAPGTYNVSVSADGYGPVNVTVATGSLGNHTAIALLPNAASGTKAATLVLGPIGIAGALAAVALGAIALVLLVRGRRARRASEGEPVEADYRIVGEPPRSR